MSIRNNPHAKKIVSIDPFTVANKEVQLTSNRTKFQQFHSEETIESAKSETKMIDLKEEAEKPRLTISIRQ